MKPITGYKKFYAAIDKMEADMEAFAKDQKESFWASRYDHETLKSECKPYPKNKNLWLGIVKVNGGSKNGHGYDAPCVFIWRTIECYMTGKSDAEIMEKSETKKVLHSENGYDFCLVRDNLRQRTDTYWGKKFIYEINGKNYHHKMVVMKKDKIVAEAFERWAFTNLCESGGYVEEEERNPETPTEIFRYFNPFKLLIVPFTDKKYTELSMKRYGKNCQNEPHNIIDELENRFGYKRTRENLWIVHIMGMGRNQRRHLDKHITTWWIISSNTKPTQDEALAELMRELQIYDQENFAELMVHFKDDLGLNLNKINILAEQRIMDLYQRKLIDTLETLMDVRWKELRDFWNKNVTF